MDSADFDALEARAREKLSPGAYAFAAGGADDEITLADNLAAWRRLRMRPHMLRDITAIDTSASVLGERLAMPLMVAPTGRHRLFHPEGERATARGAAAAGVPYVMATASTVSIEEGAAERLSAPQWFQLYLPPERSVTEGLIDRIAAAMGSRAEVYVDGGIRRGTDIVKALALGARAVLIGRPAVWGLATGGAEGVRDVFTHLRAELARTMALCGVAKLDEVTRDLVA